MKRLFWLGLGVATGVILTRKAAEAAQRLTPAGVGEQVGDGLRELAAAIGSFGAEVRAGMSEREHELTDMVEQRTGQPLPGMSSAGQPARRRAPGAGDRG
ncbi:MAG: hypothetical protein QOC67_1818 [Pseudonocardiales bacterium]|jgi:hypothetical protein|nr:hypothetical protein [Pseudonocardia sp.]MDT7590139.1 hypothetical protein [Pseudonocardiales bacterium]MDT7591173.1 hypothetical protein [Pseudonocardiales bacterium]MDT7608515.1 hypothetical protein [Pseudonocardiales bacterium]MDT7622305.1 hypothetical protein [Pseudonocardiales bacterium]